MVEQESSSKQLRDFSSREVLLKKPVSELTFVAFDSEATGRHPIISGLLELAGVKFKGNGKIIDSRSQLINPLRKIPEEVIKIHGITDELVQGKPVLAEVVPAFLQWMQSDEGGVHDDSDSNIFIAHNAGFDLGFLQVALTRLGLPLPGNPVIDTLALARKFLPDARNHKLQTLVEYFRHESKSGFHRAGPDSWHLTRVFLDILKKAGNNCTLADLVDACGVLNFNLAFEEFADPHKSSNRKVAVIGESIKQGSDLYIHYRGHGLKFRQVTPLTVLYSERRYYLRAYCHASENERTFRVNRISGLELVERRRGQS